MTAAPDSWERAAADLTAVVAAIGASLDRRDWGALGSAGWVPPEASGPLPADARDRLLEAATAIVELREQVAAELARVESDLAAIADRRRAGRAYLEASPTQ